MTQRKSQIVLPSAIDKNLDRNHLVILNYFFGFLFKNLCLNLKICESNNVLPSAQDKNLDGNLGVI